jgi:ABC-type transport system substrate-binding protein
LIGQRLAERYEILSELGRGGMGVVYRAHDPRLNRDVAIKLIQASQLSADMEQRFQREAQLVAQMDHPSIVPIYDFGRHEETLYFVMALVEGTNLLGFLRQGASLGDVVDIGIQVAEALEYSHARGVVHRDIKPENMMVARQPGRGLRVRVMDFGLARAATEGRITKTGTLIGTLQYLSPEQITSRDVDGRSDLYALGTVLYECVAGQPPFAGEPQSVVYRIVHEFPQPPRERGAVIDQALEALILRCLEKDPAMRPAGGGELAEALRRYRATLRESDSARNASELTRTLQIDRPAQAPFIGRARESGELQKRLNAAIAGECQFAIVGGEPGIGKTRLLDELEQLAKARQIRVRHGRSVEQDRGLPFQEFFEVIFEHFRIKDTSSTPPPDLTDLAPELVALFPMLGEVAEVRAAAGSGASLDRRGGTGSESRAHIFELLARTLARIAAGRPMVVLLEDLHAADVSLEALEYIVRRLGPSPLLIVGTYRTTDVQARHPLNRLIEGFQGERRAVSFVLGPLSPSEHRSFLELLVGAGVTAGLVKKLYQGSEANPFFTKELVRSLVDSGAIAKDASGVWDLSAKAGLTTDALPETIQKAVEKRIGRLPDELRDVLSVASVIGRSFDARDLAALSQAKDIDDAIDRLVEQGLIEEERESRGDLLSFSSGIVRDVLYAGLSPRKRRSLHRKCAELVETRHAGRVERVLPQLVHHFFEGDVPEKTVEYALRLAARSLDAFSAEEAIRSATAALTFLDDEWEGPRSVEGETRLLLARARRMNADLESALRETTLAIRVFDETRETVRLADALLFAAETAWQARLPDEASRFVERGLTVAREISDIEHLSRLLSLAGTLSNLAGEYDRANVYLEEAARIGRQIQEAGSTERLDPAGRLAVALANPVAAIDPVAAKISEETEIGATVFETLLSTDATGLLVPWLSERWSVADEGRTYRLTLRRGVHFSDGAPLTSGAVKLSIEASCRTASTLPAAFAAIRGAHELSSGHADEISGLVPRGDDELEIHLLEPLPIYPALLTEGSTAVVRSTATGPIGTGPFSLSVQTPDRVVVQRNASYWRSGVPRLEAIDFIPAVQAATIGRRFRAGEIDLARDLLPQDLEEISRDPRFRPGLVETPKKNTYFLLFNARCGPAARDPRVRRALAGVVRARDLVWQTLGRFAEPAVCLIPPGMLGHDAGRRWPSLTRDQALGLLGDAGQTHITLTAVVQPNLRDRAGALVENLLAVWADLGVDVRSETVDMTSYLASWTDNASIDLMIGRWNADYDDTDNFTYTLFHSGSGGLRNYFSSPEADRVLEDARAEARPAVRESLYRRFEDQLVEQAVLVPLFHDIDYRLASPRVRGLRLSSTHPYVNYSDLGIAESPGVVPDTRRAGAGVVHVPVPDAIMSLDPVQQTFAELADVLPAVFETLTSQRGLARLEPCLASSVRPEAGGQRYRFQLREGVRFHNGQRLTARDVRYSLERVLRQSPEREQFWSIRGARALSDGAAGDLAGFSIHSATEFTIDLEDPISFFPAILSCSPVAILPEGGDPGAGPEGWIGTGPFRVAAFEPGRRLDLERNKTYWRSGYPRSERLELTFGISPEHMLAGFRDGRFSLVSDLFPADVEQLRREPEFASGYKESPRLTGYYAVFNMRRGPLVDRALRRRLVHSVDVPRLVRQTVGRFGIPAYGVIPPGLLGHDAEARPRAAERESAARISERIELTVAIHPKFQGPFVAVARELTDAFESAGFTLRSVTTTMAEYNEALTRGSIDLALARWNADYPDADSFAGILHSTRGWFGRLCNSSDTDRLIERARAETTPAVRHTLYRELEEIVAREAQVLPLFYEQSYRIARPELEGLSLSLGFPTVAFEELRLRS